MIRPLSGAPDNPTGSLIPRVLAQSEVTISGDTVEVLLPRHNDPLIKRYFAPRMKRAKRYERFPLDSRGSRIWCLIDNRRSVDELIAEYLKCYPEDHRQLEQRIHGYLKILVDHGFIEIVTT